jgi:hypothetical protein
MGVIWRGSEDIHEAPSSPRRVLTATAQRVVRVFHGPYSALVAAEPDIGSEMVGFSGLYVEQVETVPDGAGADGPGVMTVTLAVEWVAGTDSGLPSYECEWTMIERDLRLHTRYATGGANALTAADLTQLKKWEGEDDEAKRAAFQFTKADGTSGTLSANAQHIAGKILRGQTSYIVPAPVARRTTYSYSVPSTSGCGQRGNPPAATGYPSGYEWIKTSDRRMRQGSGKWERIEEWTGADTVDADIYT